MLQEKSAGIKFQKRYLRYSFPWRVTRFTKREILRSLTNFIEFRVLQTDLSLELHLRGPTLFFFFLRFYLFIHRDTQREREREAETQAEEEAGSMQGA